MAKAVALLIAACMLTSAAARNSRSARNLDEPPSTDEEPVTPQQEVENIVRIHLKDVQINREEDQEQMKSVWKICESYTTPAERRMAEIAAKISEAERGVEEDVQEQTSDIVPVTMEDELEQTQNQIKEQEMFLEPFKEISEIVDQPHQRWTEVLDTHKATFDASPKDDKEEEPKEKAPKEEASKEEATALLELQHGSRALRRHHAVAAVALKESKGSTPKAGDDKDLEKAMQALFDMFESVEAHSESQHKAISNEVAKARAGHEMQLAVLKEKLKQITGKEEKLLDDGLDAKEDAEAIQVTLEQLKADLAAATQEQSKEFNMCKLYKGEFDEREVHRKALEGLMNKLAGLGVKAEAVLEEKLTSTCCPCGETCEDGSAECDYCEMAESLDELQEEESQSEEGGELALVSDDEANEIEEQAEATQAELDAILSG